MKKGIPFLAFSALLATPAFAQTNGTLATQTAANWTTAPWTNLTGPGSFPDAGGIAFLNAVENPVIGTVTPASTTLTLDTPITLSGITYDSPFNYTIAGSVTNNLTLDFFGATFNVIRSIGNSPTAFTTAHAISAPITGGGASGLTKTGSGMLQLSGANTYTGGTHINGGMLQVAGGDASLGATGAGNDISIDGGTMYVRLVALNTARNITLGSGGGMIQINLATTIGGVISGAGDLTYRNVATVSLTLTGANTYTGATILGASNNSLVLSGAAGGILSSSSYDFSGAVRLDNASANNNNRLGDAVAITSRGSTITLAGNAAVPTAESIGALTLNGGVTTLTVTPHAAQQASLNIASITRDGRAALVVRGNSLGLTPGNGVAQITAGTAPGPLSGGGGALGSTQLSILPWAVANQGTTTTSYGLVTFANGAFRPLTAAEYTSGLTGSLDNARITASASFAGGSVNALLFSPSAANSTLSSSAPITITSGALLYSPTGSVAGGAISAPLEFGAAEGIITASHELTLSGVISGTGGLTLNNLSSTASVTLSGASTYTGQTTILGGVHRFTGNTSKDGVTPGPFGLSQTTLVFQPGSASTALYANAAATIDRDLLVKNSGLGTVSIGTWSSGYTLTVNGGITLERALTLDAFSTVDSAVVLHGAITGAGSLTDANNTFAILDNAGNTFSGGLNIQTGTYAAGADNAFGTGKISFTSTGKIQSADATPRTLGNDIFTLATPTFQGLGSLTFTGSLDLNGPRSITVSTTTPAKITFAGEVKNGALTKAGTGTMNLARPSGNTYPGGTLLGANAGTLEVNNTTGSGTGAGTVSIGTGSSLAGSFTISGSTLVSGTLSPGPAEGGIGAAKFGNDLSLGSASTTNIQIAGASSFDTISVTGTASLDGTIAISLVGGYVPDYGSVFQFFGWGNVLASGFNPATDFDFSNAGGASKWDVSNFLTNGSITAIPEPHETAVALAALLVAAVLLRRRVRD